MQLLWSLAAEPGPHVARMTPSTLPGAMSARTAEGNARDHVRARSALRVAYAVVIVLIALAVVGAVMTTAISSLAHEGALSLLPGAR
jgi:hypothetical protein